MHILRRCFPFRNPEVFRCFSSLPPCESVVAEPLEQRGLVRVAGEGAYGFLQGLMTNDISHIQSGISSMYSMFLNTRGRVVYDTIIYQSAERGVLYIECDSSVTSLLAKHLKVYRLRKQVSIDIEDGFKVWSVYDPSINQSQKPVNLVDNIRDHLLGKVLPCEELELSKKERRDGFSINSISSKNNVLIFRDPRISELGLRVVCPSNEDVTKLLGVGRGSSYRYLRYSLGVGEGVLDLPPDECFPLEANCDYLHGVSFHKGCYIGQELTARVYHTGVVRKRLMPLVLDSPITESNAKKQEVLNENKKAVGKVRGVDGLAALGILRISEVLSAKSLILCSTNVKTIRPSWWPKQAPKELESKEKQ